MKKTNLLALTLLIINFSFFIPILRAQQWQMVWNDEFDGTGLPDASKWSFDTQGNNWDWGNNEAQNYTPASNNNAWQESGNLIIEARKENYTWSGDNETTPYTSARLISKGKGDWLYGKMEVRAKLPTGKGMWPAIWMLSTDDTYGGWPKSGEIDIMENVGYDPNRVHFNIHTEAYNHTIGTNKGANTLVTAPYNNFHTYFLEWNADSVKLGVDGSVVFTFLRESNDYKVWPFNKRFFMILNIAVGGGWGGAQGIDDAIFPQKMYVDYVRVYQKQSTDSFAVNVSANTGGLVAKSPDQIKYSSGSQVSLTATPDKSHQFAYWSGDISSTTNPYSLSVVEDVTAVANFKHWCEAVNNGDFSDATAFWELSKNDGAAGTLTNVNGEAQVSITNAGTNLWSISLIQKGLKVEQGKQYYLSFDAKATAARTIKAGVGMSVDPWATYTYPTVNLTTTMQHFSFPFTMSQATDNAARIVMDMGQNAEDITFDNISLACMDITTVIRSENDAFFSLKMEDNKIHISMQKTVVEAKEISIFDITGRCLKTFASKENEVLVPTAGLASGLYIVSVKTATQTVSKKIKL